MLGFAVVAAASLQLVNVSTHEVQADGHSFHADLSRDGHVVVFDSLAANLSGGCGGEPGR